MDILDLHPRIGQIQEDAETSHRVQCCAANVFCGEGEETIGLQADQRQSREHCEGSGLGIEEREEERTKKGFNDVNAP